MPKDANIASSDETFSIRLVGDIPASRTNDLNHDLANAKLHITLSAHLPDGRYLGPSTYSIPLRTTTCGDMAELSIRDATGGHLEHLKTGRNYIIAHVWIPGAFLNTGEWTFEVLSKLEDQTCLFAMSLTQWLEGQLQE